MMAHEPDEEEEVAGLINTAKEKLLVPLGLLLSPAARRAYLRTFFLVLAAASLLGVAATAYIFFYATYVPVRGLSRPVYLQFDPASSRHPVGVVSLGRDLISGQPYDVHGVLNLPRTPANRRAGNFMVDVKLQAPGDGKVAAAIAEAVAGDAALETLAHSRRPAMLTYYSTVMEQVHKAAQLPWYVMGWRREAEVIRVEMMRGVEFARGWKSVPATARVELSSDTKLQVYDATLVFTTKLRGLRYLMYNYRIISFFVFTSLFWVAEMASAITGWFFLSYMLLQRRTADEPKRLDKAPKAEEGDVAIKTDNEDQEAVDEMSDTERSFPTYSRQPPLRYTSPTVKKEEDEPSMPLAELPVAGADADDEDDDFVLENGSQTRAPGLHSDSGLGTSMESSASRRDSVRRRRSGGPGGKD